MSSRSLDVSYRSELTFSCGIGCTIVEVLVYDVLSVALKTRLCLHP
jgi:hypothetical protein